METKTLEQIIEMMAQKHIEEDDLYYKQTKEH